MRSHLMILRLLSEKFERFVFLSEVKKFTKDLHLYNKYAIELKVCTKFND